MDFVEIIEDLKRKEEETNKWKNSKFKTFKELSLTSRGKVGEIFIANVLETLPIGEKTKKEEYTYDILFNNLKIEVKTASVGNKNNTFQYENFYYTADYVVFVSIDVNDLYITLLHKDNLKEVMSLHSRHDTNAVKFTTSLTKLKKNIGRDTIVYSSNEELKKWLISKLKKTL